MPTTTTDPAEVLSPDQAAAMMQDIERDMATERALAELRTPVGVAVGPDVRPIVICRDGSAWELASKWDTADGVTETREDYWKRLPSIPGSRASSASDVR